MQLVLHPEQARRLRFLDAGHRNAGPSTDDEGHGLLVDHGTRGLALVLPVGLHLANLALQVALAIA